LPPLPNDACPADLERVLVADAVDNGECGGDEKDDREREDAVVGDLGDPNDDAGESDLTSDDDLLDADGGDLNTDCEDPTDTCKGDLIGVASKRGRFAPGCFATSAVFVLRV
jgi:hypothetical protein